MGTDLTTNMRKQSERFGTAIYTETIEKVRSRLCHTLQYMSCTILNPAPPHTHGMLM
jgi:hypothetical protein